MWCGAGKAPTYLTSWPPALAIYSSRGRMRRLLAMCCSRAMPHSCGQVPAQPTGHSGLLVGLLIALAIVAAIAWIGKAVLP